MYVENPVSCESFFRIFYYPEAGYFLWFIWSLWLIFIVFPFFSINQTRRNWLYAVVFLLSYIPIQWTEIFCVNQTIHMARYFVMGMLIFDYRNFVLPLNRIPKIVPILLFFTGFTMRENVLINELLPYLGVWMTLVISTKISQRDNWINKVIMTISIASYIIYLFHTTFEGFAKGVLHKFPLFMAGGDVSMFILGASIIIISGIIFPIALYKYVIRKYYFTRFLFGIK